ncbi:unnamed protein product [Calicophoron daubneyi]
MPFPTDPRLASYFLPGYPAAIAAAMAAVNAASSTAQQQQSTTPNTTGSLFAVPTNGTATAPASLWAPATNPTLWSNGGGGSTSSSSASSSGYASSEGSMVNGLNGAGPGGWFNSAASSGGFSLSHYYPYTNTQRPLVNSSLRSDETALPDISLGNSTGRPNRAGYNPIQSLGLNAGGVNESDRGIKDSMGFVINAVSHFLTLNPKFHPLTDTCEQTHTRTRSRVQVLSSWRILHHVSCSDLVSVPSIASITSPPFHTPLFTTTTTTNIATLPPIRSMAS